MGNFRKIVAVRPAVRITKSLSLDEIEITEPKTLGGGFSGALVQEFRLGQKSSPLAKELMNDNSLYIIKTMEKTQFRDLKEEQDTYRQITENPNYDELTKIYVQSISIQERNVVVTQKAEGNKLLAQALLAGELSKHVYNDVTKSTLTHLTRHFTKNQMSPEEFYAKTGKYVDQDAANMHVQDQTLGRVIDRLSAFKQKEDFESTLPIVFAKRAMVNGVQLENPLLLFLDLHERTNEVFAKFPELCDPERPPMDPHLKTAILNVLLPRTMSPMPSDPSPTNEMIGGPANTPNCFDPGEIRTEQFSFPISKHEGPFAQFFLFIVFQKYMVEHCKESGICLNINCNQEVWKNQQEIHSFDSVKERMEAIPEAKKLLEEKPFLLLALFFFGYRQFGSDIVYRETENDVYADFALFALGMRYIKSVFEHLVETIKTNWPEESFQTVVTNKDNNHKLSDCVVQAFKSSEALEPRHLLSHNEIAFLA